MSDVMTKPIVTVEAGLWQAYTLDMGAAEIRRRFAARYGYEPERVRSGGSVNLAGPIREGTHDRATA